MGDFNAQDLTISAWAFATAGGPVPAMLNPNSVLDMMDVRGFKTQVLHYQILMQCYTATGRI